MNKADDDVEAESRDIPPLTIVQQVKDWTAVAGSQTGHRLWQHARVIVKGGRIMNWNRRSNRTDRLVRATEQWSNKDLQVGRENETNRNEFAFHRQFDAANENITIMSDAAILRLQLLFCMKRSRWSHSFVPRSSQGHLVRLSRCNKPF